MTLVRNHKPVEISSKQGPHWIPPVPREPKRLQWRILPMLCVLVAAGPLILFAQTAYPYVTRDRGLLVFYGGFVGAVAIATLVAFIAGRLPVVIVAIAAAVSLFFAARAVLYFVYSLNREVVRANNVFNTSSGSIVDAQKVVVYLLALSISIGLLIGLVITLRRDA